MSDNNKQNKEGTTPEESPDGMFERKGSDGGVVKGQTNDEEDEVY